MSLQRQLHLLRIMTKNGPQTVEVLAEKTGLCARMVYRYIKQLGKLGFDVIKTGNAYSIDSNSPYFKDITQGFRFSEDEALTILHVLNSVMDRTPQVRHLREKLSSLHDSQKMKEYGVDEQVAKNLAVLYTAITCEQMVCLRNYSSPHSGKVSDRIVEPFVFLPGNNDVRCYELATGENKTFKVSRAERVELIDLCWSYRDRHRPFNTDIFNFSGEDVYRIVLRLGQLSHNVLLEEHPYAEQYMTPEPNGTYLLETDVCDFKGISRFVLGLYEDIEVIGSQEFRDYLNDKIAKMKSC